MSKIEEIIEEVKKDPHTPYKKGVLAALTQVALGLNAHKSAVHRKSNGTGKIRDVKTSPGAMTSDQIHGIKNN